MAAFTTMALVGAAVVGTGATLAGISEQKKAAAQQEARLDAQETAAKEAAALEETRLETGADIELGRDDGKPSSSGLAMQASATSKRAGSVAANTSLTPKGTVGSMVSSKRNPTKATRQTNVARSIGL